MRTVLSCLLLHVFLAAISAYGSGDPDREIQYAQSPAQAYPKINGGRSDGECRAQIFPSSQIQWLSHSVQPLGRVGGGRNLKQTSRRGRRSSLGIDCALLTERETRQYLDSEIRIWSIDDDVLRTIGNDLQVVVNCTAPGDIIFLEASETIRPSRPVTIPWNLTWTTPVSNAQLVGGVFPSANFKAELQCPDNNEGLFRIQGSSLLLANMRLVGYTSSRDESGDAVLAITGCAENGGPSVQLHHVDIVDNILHGPSTIDVETTSCASVELINVRFENNDCIGSCFGVFGRENSFEDVTIVRNTQSLSFRKNVAMIMMPRGSTTRVTNLTASRNIGIIMEIRGGVFRLSDSTFSRNRGNLTTNEDEFGACLHFVESEASIERCTFSRNRGHQGSSIVLNGAQLTLRHSVFTKNFAMNGGGVYVMVYSTMTATRSNFTLNRAVDGGAGYFDASVFEGSNLRLAQNNVDDDGGGFFFRNSSQFILTRTTMSRNLGAYGSCTAQFSNSSGTIHRCVFNENRATSYGGVGFMFRSSLSITESNFTNATAREGGFFRVYESTFSVRETTFVNSTANEGGCLQLYTAIVNISDASFALCNASIIGGAMKVTQGTVISLVRTRFTRNKSGDDGGAVYVSESELSAKNLLFDLNEASDDGGGLFVAGEGTIDLVDIVFVNCTAEFGGLAAIVSDVSGHIVNSTFLQGRARTGGGALRIGASNITFSNCTFADTVGEFAATFIVALSARVRIKHSTIARSEAYKSGGCINCFSGGRVSMKNVTVEDCKAGQNGGVFYATDGAVIDLIYSSFSNISAGTSGGVAWVAAATFNARRCVFRDTHAGQEGGLIYGNNMANVSIKHSIMHNDSARSGGCIWSQASSVRVADSTFDLSKASAEGGWIDAREMTNLTILRSTFVRATAEYGGAIALSGSRFKGVKIQVSQCRAAIDGGAIYSTTASVVLCSECDLFHNSAGRQGGALAIGTFDPQSLPVQLDQCSIRNNTARIGGGVSFDARAGIVVDCPERKRTPCVFVALTSTEIVGNEAARVGGGMFIPYLSKLRFNCTSTATAPKNRFHTEKQLRSLQVAKNQSDLCPEWTGNVAGEYGDVITTYASKTRVKIFDGDDDEKATVMMGGDYVIRAHRSGLPLPVITVDILDGLEQGPVVDSGNGIVKAIMSSPDDFIVGSVVSPLKEGKGRLNQVTGFQSQGLYHIEVTFSDQALKTVRFGVEIRSCVAGEATTSDGSLCQTCNTHTFNFRKSNGSTCQPCPPNGNCSGSAIHPMKGYWHQSPCSEHIHRCLTRTACNYELREAKLEAIIKNVVDCNFSTDMIASYGAAQCKKGHHGPICGACDVSYGRSQSFTCEKCLSGIENAAIILASVLILIGLSAFTIRSNLTSKAGTRATISYRTENSTTVQASYATAAADSDYDTVVEMRSGATSENTIPLPPQGQPSLTTLTRNSELLKWKVAETFKITINFLQVTAVAISINVDWHSAVLELYETLEFLSGITSEAVGRSVDCILDEDASALRSVVGVLIAMSVPLSVIMFFATFWTAKTVAFSKTRWYFLKMTALSIVAVFYISYISVTKTLIQILNCIDVHDSITLKEEGVLVESTTRFWAVDTSLRCYEAEHALLAEVVGWPCLIAFSIGFPTISAYLIVSRVQNDYKSGWIYEVFGFLYRAYKPKVVYWESVVMLRKAVLALVVVLSYPLGGSLQAALAVSVLALALYFHTIFRPYRSEFDDLNTTESGSLLLSLMTFVSSLFYADDRVPEGVLVLISVTIALSNILLLTYLFLSMLRIGTQYLETILSKERVPFVPNGGPIHVLRIYIFRYVIKNIKHKVTTRFTKIFGERDTNHFRPNVAN